MCGIAGFVDFTKQSSLEDREGSISNMVSALTHRGPDSKGFWFDDRSPLTFGHSRLSIQEISHIGHQPMESFDKKIVITFNGEIYNHLLLRENLKELPWKGNSDTQTLVNYISYFGIEKTLKDIKGQFAFCAFNRATKELYLCRDRFGEKPLYYYKDSDKFIFASEIKSIKKFNNLNLTISNNALDEILLFSYVSSPKSIFNEVNKLEAGTLLKLSLHYGAFKSQQIRYWSIGEQDNKIFENINYQESKETLNKLLNNSVNEQLISDVPIGSFLSGGIDSSLISAVMQNQSMEPINTFSIGFENNGFDEAPYAKNIAKFLNSNHHEIYVTEQDLLDIIPILPEMYSEPFADSSQIPTALISSIAKRDVTVILSGDGADELFGGYNRYSWVPKIWKYAGILPIGLRKNLSDFFIKLSQVNSIAKLLSTNIPLYDNKIQKLGSALATSSSLESFFKNVQLTFDPTFIESLEDFEYLNNPVTGNSDFQKFMMTHDINCYLPDDILCKVDRASMYYSLETRAPYLDKDLAAFAYSLPVRHKIAGSKKKIILKDLLSEYIPLSLFDRPKAGFSIPLGDWLKGPLRDWAETLILEDVDFKHPLLANNLMEKVANAYFRNDKELTSTVWNIIMFKSWYKTSIK